MAFASILNDPYIQRELKALKKTIRSISNTKIFTSAEQDDIETASMKGVSISYSKPLDSVVGNLLTKSTELDSRVENDELKSFEELIQQLPAVSWKNSLERELTTDVKKNNLLKKLDSLSNAEKIKQIHDIKSLKSFSRDIQRVFDDLEKVLPDDEFDTLGETKQSLKEIVDSKMKELFSDDPIENYTKHFKEMESQKDDPEILIKLLSSLKEQLHLAREQVTIPLVQAERKALRLSYLDAEKEYIKAVEFLVHQYPNANNETKEKILEELEISEYKELKDKQAFITYLDQVANSFKELTEKQAKDFVQNQLGHYLAVNAEEPNELKKAFNLMNLIPFKKIHGDHQELVAEILLENDKEIVKSLDIERILETIKKHNEDIEQVLKAFNSATSIDKMKRILNTSFQEVWTNLEVDKQDVVAQQFLLRIGTRPYRTLNKIENDFKKAEKKRLVSEADFKKLPFACTYNENEVFHLASNVALENPILIRPEAVNNNFESADTLTLIF